MKNINKLKTTKTHLGIQVLRFLLCFWVVIIHCSFVEKKHRKYLFKHFHVPTFFVLSFYFYYPIISSKNNKKIISRFQRLLLPYIFWPFVKLILVTKKFRLKDIFLQLLIGKPIHGIFWFQFNLIFLSLFFAIILFAFNKNGINILMLIGLFCYFLHLTCLVYNILLKYKSFVKSSIGCLLEMMPLAVNGSIVKSKNLFSIEEQYSIFLISFYFLHFLYYSIMIFFLKNKDFCILMYL
jgi:fucose 4-O-acetylase-like acetyltransferase